MFDPATKTAHALAKGAVARAQAVRDSLGSGTLTVELRDGETLVYSGTFTGPMTAGGDGSLSVDVLLSGAVTTGGTPNAATWTCRIRNADGRYIEGSFGPGGRFTWSGGALVVGQAVRLRVSIAAANAELQVVTDFDTGNVDQALVEITAATSETPTVWLDSRSAAGLWRHFSFAVENVQGKRPIFRFNRATKDANTLTPSVDYRPVWTQDFVTWTRAPSRTLVGGPTGYIEWQFTDPLPGGRVYVSSHPIGRQADAAAFAAELLAGYSSVVQPAESADANGVYSTSPSETDDLSREAGLHPQYALSLTWPGPTTDSEPKRTLVLHAGIHAAGENQSWWPFTFFVRWLLDDPSQAAQDFRANWDVLLYFALSPNAIWSGYRRVNPSRATDPNRTFVLTGSSSIAEITAFRAAVESDTGGTCDAFIGWHGHNTETGIFIPTKDPDSTDPLIAAVIAQGEPIFGVAATNYESSATNTDRWWGREKLGATLSTNAEIGTLGTTDIAVYQHIGESWAKTLQAVDALGLFTE